MSERRSQERGRGEVVFATVDMLGHMMPMIPLMAEILSRGYQVTVICPSSPKYRNTLNQLGLKDVRILGYEPPAESITSVSLFQKISSVTKGGPLATMSAPMFDAAIAEYENKIPPLVFIADFFASSIFDVADYLSVPAIGYFPNPFGLTSLRAPHRRGWKDVPEVWKCWIGEAIMSRLLLFGRNCERASRNVPYRLPPMMEQDVYPSLSMRRPFLASTTYGFEYAYPQSPLLQFTGPSPPPNHLTRNPQEDSPDLFAWLGNQEAVVYVAFGTMHKFTEETVNILLRQLMNFTSMKQQKYQKNMSVLWSLPEVQQKMLNTTGSDVTSARIRLETFVPQWDILVSPKVVAFVSHCGANSIYESLLNGVPLVCCPGKADQPANAARIENVNAGVISRQGVHSVEQCLQDIVNDLATFTENALRISRIFNSQGGAKTGANFVEGIITCGVQRLMPHESYNDRCSFTKWFSFISISLVSAIAMYMYGKE